MNKLRIFIKHHSKLLLAIGGLLLVLYIFVPQLSDLKESLQAVKSADKSLTALAILVFCIGFPVVAIKYFLIAQFQLKYKLTLQVQTASAFVSKLLPMSIGSLTVNTYYLTEESKSPVAAASTMSINALTSTVAFITLIIFAVVASWGTFSLEGAKDNISWLAVLGVIILLTAIIWGLLRVKKIRGWINKGFFSVWADIKTYKKQPKKVTWGILFNGLGSITGIATLYICTHAVGLDVTFAQAILSYTLGNIIGSLVPTPGGLGGVEAGLYSGLVFFGYDTSTSMVAVLLYRLISYWIPILPGYFMYRHLRKTSLKDFKIKKPATS